MRPGIAYLKRVKHLFWFKLRSFKLISYNSSILSSCSTGLWIVFLLSRHFAGSNINMVSRSEVDRKEDLRVSELSIFPGTLRGMKEF